MRGALGSGGGERRRGGEWHEGAFTDRAQTIRKRRLFMGLLVGVCAIPKGMASTWTNTVGAAIIRKVEVTIGGAVVASAERKGWFWQRGKPLQVREQQTLRVLMLCLARCQLPWTVRENVATFVRFERFEQVGIFKNVDGGYWGRELDQLTAPTGRGLR